MSSSFARPYPGGACTRWLAAAFVTHERPIAKALHRSSGGWRAHAGTLCQGVQDVKTGPLAEHAAITNAPRKSETSVTVGYTLVPCPSPT